jgi:hypothetical protein
MSSVINRRQDGAPSASCDVPHHARGCRDDTPSPGHGCRECLGADVGRPRYRAQEYVPRELQGSHGDNPHAVDRAQEHARDHARVHTTQHASATGRPVSIRILARRASAAARSRPGHVRLPSVAVPKTSRHRNRDDMKSSREYRREVQGGLLRFGTSPSEPVVRIWVSSPKRSFAHRIAAC